MSYQFESTNVNHIYRVDPMEWEGDPVPHFVQLHMDSLGTTCSDQLCSAAQCIMQYYTIYTGNVMHSDSNDEEKYSSPAGALRPKELVVCFHLL